MLYHLREILRIRVWNNNEGVIFTLYPHAARISSNEHDAIFEITKQPTRFLTLRFIDPVVTIIVC